MIIFEITDKTNRKIRLTKERWSHITSPSSLHAYMTNHIKEIKESLIKPNKIINNPCDENKANYYKYYRDKRKYVKVVVKFIMTRVLS